MSSRTARATQKPCPEKQHQQQIHCEGDHGPAHIYNNLKEIKISRNKPNRRGKNFYSENFKSLREEIEKDTGG